MQQPLMFNEHGLLPIGEYHLTLEELRTSILLAGIPGSNEPWDRDWRLHLVNNLAILVGQLWQEGITNIYINGSFVEMKAHPNDIDGYFECSRDDITSDRLRTELNRLDPFHVWTWRWSDRIFAPNSTKPQLPMWHRYRVELYPEYGQLSGIVDEFGNQQQFPAAFRKTRNSFMPKGIVQIVRRS